MTNSFWLAVLSALIVLLPTGESDDAGLISTLKDAQKAFDILHRIDDQEEQLHFYVADKDLEQIRPFISQCISTCESLKGKTYTNVALSTHMQNYLDQAIRNYLTFNKDRPRQDAFKKELDDHNAQRRSLAGFLVATYDLSHFVHLTEDTYWKTVDKKNYIRSSRYSDYMVLRKHDPSKALSLLDSIYRATPDFQEKTIYQLEAADLCVTVVRPSDSGTNLAIQKYKSILDENQYCLYLYEAWLKWRVVSQQNSGLSKSSDIPNDQYDDVRDQVADLILAHIQENTKDEMAINQFLVIVTHDIIFRFGAYPYGNQNTVEYHEIFQ